MKRILFIGFWFMGFMVVIQLGNRLYARMPGDADGNHKNKPVILSTTSITKPITGLSPFSKEVVVAGKWGTGDKEFGFSKQAVAPDVGPNAIATDKSENIYVLDPSNQRIVVYGTNGKLLSPVSLKLLRRYQLYNPWESSFAVDSSSNIFILTRSLDYQSDFVIAKIDRKGKLVSQFVSTARLKELFAPSTPKFQERYNKIKATPDTYIFPETVGKLIALAVDADNNVFAIAEYGILIPLSQGTPIKAISLPGYPLDQNHCLVRDPSVPLTIYLPKKPDPIKNLFVKTATGDIIATLKADDIKKHLPAGAKIDDIQYKGNDVAGNKYFLVLTEGIEDRCFIVRFAPDWSPSAVTAIQDITSYPFVISRGGNIFQLVWDSDKINDGVKILKWMVKP